MSWATMARHAALSSDTAQMISATPLSANGSLACSLKFVLPRTARMPPSMTVVVVIVTSAALYGLTGPGAWGTSLASLSSIGSDCAGLTVVLAFVFACWRSNGGDPPFPCAQGYRQPEL